MDKGTLVSRHQIDLANEEFGKMRRSFELDRAGINKEERTVPLSFASEEPVDRWFGREILDISKDACDLSRLNNGGAVLVNHDWDRQVGVVMSATVDSAAKKCRAVVKFSRSEDGDEIFQDICDGIRRLVSVGYIVRKMVLQSVEGDTETHRCTDWQPYEVSIVAVPADTTVGVGRSVQSKVEKKATVEAATPTVTQSRSMSENSPAAVAPVAPAAPAAPVADLGAERQRIKDINAAAKVLAERHPKHVDAFRQLAAKCAETGDNADAFNRTVLNDILKTERELAPVRQDQEAGSVGLKPKDIRRYSILRAIRAIAEGKPLDGLERECNDELVKKLDRQPTGFFMPDEVAADRRSVRTNYAQSPADGGFTVGQDLLANELVTYLRNNAVVAQLGARTIGGLVGNVSIPRQLTGATAYWTDEGTAITQSSATFGQIVSRPRRIGTSVPYSKQFIAQTSLDAESFIVNDSDASIALDIDRVALRGIGGVEPLGIANLATADRSTSVTFGASPTWAKYLEFLSSVAASNAVLGAPAYVASVAAAVKAMSTAKFTNTGFPIWDNDMVGTFRARWTTQLLTSATPVANMVIFGDFSQVLLLEWAGRDVVVDPYAYKKEGNVEVTISRLMDVVIRRAKSFAISSDSGAQ